MILKTIRLNNYRNYDQMELKTNQMTHLFLGMNAQGKTNLLEAIYVLALSKSHRTFKDKELIQWEKEHASIWGEIEKKYGRYDIELNITQTGKRAKVNGLEQKRLSEFIGTLNVVMFAPEDLELVKGSPGIRRRFLDMEMGQVHPRYVYDLNQYQKILIQRNQCLKQIERYTPKPQEQDMLEIWNEQLSLYGSKIIKKRQTFIKKLENWAKDIHQSITGGKECLEINYRPSFDIQDFQDESVVQSDFMIKLTQNQNQDIKRGTTHFGPHRDDILFFINGREVQIYGSQGQQRTTALSVKLAEIELIREEVGEYPILLLDDVLSELDQHRQTYLIQTFQNKVQTFITSTDIGSVDLSQLDHTAIYHVDEGKIEYSK